MHPPAPPPENKTLLVACPTCAGTSVYAPGNRFRPFCSERCKNIDIGAWASENFRMPAEAPPDQQDVGDAGRP